MTVTDGAVPPVTAFSRLSGILQGNQSQSVLDQAISSLTNLVAGIYAAHLLSPSDYGVFAVLTFIYLLVMGVTRAAYSDVAAVVSEPSARGEVVDLRACDGVLAVTVVAAAGGVFIGRLGGFGWGDLALAAAAIAVMTLQDCLRILAIARDRASWAVRMDLLWFVGLLIGIVLFELCSLKADPYKLLFLWGIASLPSAILGAYRLGWAPRITNSVAFLTIHRKLAVTFTADWSLQQGVSQAAVFGLGSVGGVSALSGVRAGQLILGPLNVLFTGLQLAFVPLAVRQFRQDPARMRRTLHGLAACLGVCAAIAGALIFVVPQSALNLLVDEQAEGLKEFILPLAVSLMAMGLAVPGTIGLRVMKAARTLLFVRILTAALVVGSGVVGVVITGTALGGLWGLALGRIASLPVWEISLGRELRTLEARRIKGDC